MNPDKIIVRFEQVDEQVEGPVRRIIGFVKAANMLTLFDAADLEANPRSARAGQVTSGILESIRKTPETFPFKTKGVLVGASDYDALDRRRYELRFINPRIEGVLDGGHNMLAIGTHILVAATGDDRLEQRLKRWSDFKEAWEDHRSEIHALKRAASGELRSTEELDFLVPIEILVPSDLDDSDTIEQFNNSLLEICAARNNNHELTVETRANKKGYYEELRKALPPSIAERIEWKTNESGDIRVRDLVALSWIPLSVLDLPIDDDGKQIDPPLPQNIYRNKGECVKLFDRLMGSPEVSKPTTGEYTRELHNEAVKSALVIAAQLPVLYDKIYMDFPEAYNSADGKFGKLDIVKMAKDMHSQPLSHFTEQPVEYRYPDGLIMPLVYGLKALLRRRKGVVEWAEDPVQFLDDNLEAIVKKYRVILNAFSMDPQKIGKNEGSYDYVLDAFETEILKRAHRS